MREIIQKQGGLIRWEIEFNQKLDLLGPNPLEVTFACLFEPFDASHNVSLWIKSFYRRCRILLTRRIGFYLRIDQD